MVLGSCRPLVNYRYDSIGTKDGAVETPIYIYFKIQPRGLTSSDWYLSSYDLIITLGVRGRKRTVSTQVSRTERPPHSKAELCI